MNYRGRMKDGVVVFEGEDRPAEGTKVYVEVVQAPVAKTLTEETPADKSAVDNKFPPK